MQPKKWHYINSLLLSELLLSTTNLQMSLHEVQGAIKMHQRIPFQWTQL